ncbi:MAG: hypothetical protein ACI85U_003933 [Candidatus Promineifilaceae bacterium]|jgi:hypothetical protein
MIPLIFANQTETSEFVGATLVALRATYKKSDLDLNLDALLNHPISSNTKTIIQLTSPLLHGRSINVHWR